MSSPERSSFGSQKPPERSLQYRGRFYASQKPTEENTIVELPQKREISKEEKARKMLNFLVDKQRRVVEKGTYDHFLGKTGEDLYEAFWHSPLSHEVEVEAEREIFRSEGNNYLTGLRGMVFAKMAFGYMTAEESEKGNIVIPEEGTIAITKILNPEAEVIENSFGLRGLKGVSLPDGFVANEKGLVSGVVEYTLSRVSGKLAYQYKGFKSLAKNMNGSLAKDGAKFIYVTPREDNGDEIIHASDAKYRDVHFEPLPVVRESFNDFILDMYGDYISENKAIQKFLK